jgi:hypothetical protein
MEREQLLSRLHYGWYSIKQILVIKRVNHKLCILTDE